MTGLVDNATAEALSDAVVAAGGEAATDALVHTTAVQTILKLAGAYDGPVDGQWTPELTEALMAFQEELGVPPTGAVDAETLNALEDAIAGDDEDEDTATTSTTAAEATTTSAPEATTTTTAPGE